jgi:hypothetical protein
MKRRVMGGCPPPKYSKHPENASERHLGPRHKTRRARSLSSSEHVYPRTLLSGAQASLLTVKACVGSPPLSSTPCEKKSVALSLGQQLQQFKRHNRRRGEIATRSHVRPFFAIDITRCSWLRRREGSRQRHQVLLGQSIRGTLAFSFLRDELRNIFCLALVRATRKLHISRSSILPFVSQTKGVCQ